MSANAIHLNGIRNELQTYVNLRRHSGMVSGEHRYDGIEDFVLQNGRAYQPAKSPHSPMPRGCYQMAHRRAGHAGSPWIYVEGYAVHPLTSLAVPHAWLTRADQPDRAYDVAWKWEYSQGAEYLGIPFRFAYVRQVFLASKRQYYGVLEAWWMHFPLITGEQRIEDVIWKPLEEGLRRRQKGGGMTAESQLEWDGRNLYRIKGKKRVFVGTIVQSTVGDLSFWDVYVRGTRKHTLNTEQTARRQLEAYA
jgi:hypothetical protein